MSEERKPLVFTIANRKGGVGKSTNIQNLAYLLAQDKYDEEGNLVEYGKKVLLIDADAQGSLTQTLGIDRSIGSSPELTVNNITKVSRTLRDQEDEPYNVDDLFGEAPEVEMSPSQFLGLHDLMSKAFYGQPLSENDVKNAILTPSYKLEKRKSEIKKLQQEGEMSADGSLTLNDLEESMYDYYSFGFDLIPSNEELTDDELVFTLDNDESRRRRKGVIMLQVVQAISKYCDYDVILIDTGPSLGILTVNAMAAAKDGIIVSASIDEQSLWSLQKFKFNIRQIKQMIPEHEGVLGVILAPYDARSQLTPIISDKIKNVLNMYLFESKIPRSNDAAKAVASGVLYSMINSKAYTAYENLAEEVLERRKINHEWEVARNEKVQKELAKLKEAHPGVNEDDLLEIVREEYSQGKLWDMPKSNYGREEETSEKEDAE